jgi:hypothetical protein
MGWTRFVVGPGSWTVANTETGCVDGKYELIHDLPIAQLPPSFTAKLKPPGRGDSHGGGIETLSCIEKAKYHLEKIADPAIQGQHGNDTTYKVACELWDFGFPLRAAIELMLIAYNPRAVPRWSENELRRIVESAYVHAKSVQGCATPEADFNRFAPDTPPHRWAHIRIPDGFLDKPDGIYQRKFRVTKEEKRELRPEKICRPMVVKSSCKRVTDSDEVIDGLVLEFLHSDGNYKEYVLACGDLSRDKRQLAGKLSDMGAGIAPGKEDQVAQYIYGFTPVGDGVRLSKTGWVPEVLTGADLVFALPNESTNSRFQLHGHTKGEAIRSAGPLQNWTSKVYPLISSIPEAMYEVFKSLSAPLLAFVSVEPHENIYGLSSTGKTTLLQIGASVWGDGGGTHAQGYIQTWNTTSNALEIVATQFNDLPLYLDELGTYHGKQMQGDSYKLASQRGKGAMDRERNARASRSWNTRITSSGEVSISSKMQDDGSGRKKVPAAGALIRFLDRKLSGSPFNTAEQVKAIKKACGKHFGSLGPAFVKEIAARFNRIEFGKRISSLLDAAHKRLLLQFPAASAISTAERAMERFALTEAAGILLVEFGLVPGLTETAVSGAVNAVVAAWAPSAANLDDMPRAVEALREATIRDSDTRFKKGNSELPLKETPWTDELRAFGKVAGKIDTTRGRVSYTDEYIEEITGREAPDVADALDSAGWLIRDVGNGDRKRIKVALDGGKQIRLYTVKYEFLQSGDTMPEEGAKNFEDLL